jgi:hypothetical protein
MGNNIYCLLTGLWPFYEWNSYSVVQEKLIQRERTYVDPRWRTRSFAEGKLVEIMEQTWEYNPSKRISIFEVVQFLRDSLEENERQEAVQRARLQPSPGFRDEKSDGNHHPGQAQQEQTMTQHMKIHYIRQRKS